MVDSKLLERREPLKATGSRARTLDPTSQPLPEKGRLHYGNPKAATEAEAKGSPTRHRRRAVLDDQLQRPVITVDKSIMILVGFGSFLTVSGFIIWCIRASVKSGSMPDDWAVESAARGIRHEHKSIG